MADREVAFNQQINAFVPEYGDPHFYYAHILVGKRLIEEASTAGMKGMVSKGRFEKIELLVSSDRVAARIRPSSSCGGEAEGGAACVAG